MANAKITLGKQSGGTLGLVFPDGETNTEVVYGLIQFICLTLSILIYKG